MPKTRRQDPQKRARIARAQDRCSLTGHRFTSRATNKTAINKEGRCMKCGLVITKEQDNG